MEEMPKNYDPSTNEPAILQKWLDGGYYKRREGVGDCTVTIPPPNVTGKLHMGHATDDSIQDAIVRMARMRGRSTRWVLGTDHAGIATQTKVDKKLKSEGISRLEIGRDKFVDACWDWTHEYGGIIVEQIKRMGCSVEHAQRLGGGNAANVDADGMVCAEPAVPAPIWRGVLKRLGAHAQTKI